MADFEKYAPKLRQLEGGWSDDPLDKGGATMAGVTLSTYRDRYGQGKTKEDLRNITDAEWNSIMRRYWDFCKADRIANQSVAEIFTDWYVNAGAHAVRNYQRACGLSVDGRVGPKTLDSLNRDPKRTFDVVQTARASYYRKIADQDRTQRRFLRGWLNRTYSFRYEP